VSIRSISIKSVSITARDLSISAVAVFVLFPGHVLYALRTLKLWAFKKKSG
jgi:hypothetical protein